LEPVFIAPSGDAFPISEAKPSESIALSTDGEALPLDIQGKTFNELKALGFKEVGQVQYKRKTFGPGYQPVIDAAS
jgi:hypothetical protein